MHIALILSILKSRLRIGVLIIGVGVILLILNRIWPGPILEELGGGSTLPDLLPFGYSYEYLSGLFQQYGVSGRRQYLIFLLSLDIIYPILYSTLLGLITWVGIRGTSLSIGRKYILSSWSFVTGGYDVLENIFLAFSVSTFPDMSPLVVHMASILTISKYLFAAIGASILLALLGVYLSNTYLSKNNGASS